MSQFHIHTIDSAPAESAAALHALEQGLGFIPNLAATMAESPIDGAFTPKMWAKPAA